MKTKYLFISALLLLCLGFIADGKIFSSEKGNVKFISIAPNEILTAESKELAGLVDFEKKFFAFAIPMSSFSGFKNGSQQQSFTDIYTESEKYPKAKFKGSIISDADFSVDGDYTAKSKGILTVHGIAKEREIAVKISRQDSVVTIQADFRILLADHKIEIPKIIQDKISKYVQVKMKMNLLAKK